MGMHLTGIRKTNKTFLFCDPDAVGCYTTMSEIDTQFFSHWTYLKKPGLQGFIQQHVDAKQLIRAVTRNKVLSC
jgi:hypothetical protein